MTYRMLLTSNRIEFPDYYWNWREFAKKKHYEWRASNINAELKEYNAEFGIDPKTGDRYVDFASEEHYSYFVLRWS